MLENYDLVFDVNNIKDKKVIADQKYNDLYKNVETFKKMIEDTKEFYDTPSSKEFRVVAEHYIDIVEAYLNGVFKPYIDKLNNIVNSYNELYNETNTSVGEGGSNEV